MITINNKTFKIRLNNLLICSSLLSRIILAKAIPPNINDTSEKVPSDWVKVVIIICLP